jgi:transcriptional regulator with XRE-family HTH domain
MTARKKSARSKKKARSAKKSGSAKSGAGRARRKSARKASTRARSAASGSKAAARRGRVKSLADRLGELVEHTAAGALRRVVDAGGRELAEWIPETSALRQEAGAYLREMRELAGLTVDELAEAIDLRDRSRLEAVEAGTSTLSFELLLRLAAILARHDPVPFVSRMVRAQNPMLWQLLEDWGIGRLPLQLEREQAFVDILRGHDRARDLSDEEFDRVAAFTRAAFEMALDFSASKGRARRSRAR